MTSTTQAEVDGRSSLRTVAQWLASFQALQLVLALGALALDSPVGWIETEAPWLNVLVPSLSLFVWWGWSAPLLYRLVAVAGMFLVLPVGAWIARSGRAARAPRLAAVVLLAAVVIAIGLQAAGLMTVYGDWPDNW